MSSIKQERVSLVKNEKNIFQVGASGCHHMGGNQMYRLNTEGQLTSGEWCTNVQQGQSVNVQWCANGATDGPWSYKEETKQVIKTNKSFKLM